MSGLDNDSFIYLFNRTDIKLFSEAARKSGLRLFLIDDIFIKICVHLYIKVDESLKKSIFLIVSHSVCIFSRN